MSGFHGVRATAHRVHTSSAPMAGSARIEPLQVERSWAQAAGSAIVCSLAVVVAGFVLGVVVGGADTAMPTARAAALRAEPVPVSGTASITIARRG